MTREQEACGLIQTKHTVPGSILYSSYWYRSGVNRTMTDNLHGIARGVEAIVPLESGDLVVDIGCNDGTLLDGYQAEGLRYLGFDPSDVARYAIAKGYDVVNDFYSAQALRAAPSRPEGQGDHEHRDVLRPRVPAHVRRRRRRGARRARHLGHGAALSPDDAGGQRLRRDRPRAPRVLLPRGDRATRRRGGPRGRLRRAQRHERRLDPPVHRSRRPARAHARAARGADARCA